MRKIYLLLLFISLLWSCKSATLINTNSISKKNEVKVAINLSEIKNDKVQVTIQPPIILTDVAIFRLPKIVPGTYSIDNFGKYIDDFKALNKNGTYLPVKKIDENSWSISNAKTLDKITYFVNDTFDTETNNGFGKEDIFSPAGSNIDAGKNIVLNTYCFVGYFDAFFSTPYSVTISHPETLWGATSMTDLDPSASKDLFVLPSYSKLVENPILYSKPDFTTFYVDDMEILVAVYSPTGKFTAKSITASMQKTIAAQKRFLGKMNTTKKYSILVYLSSLQNDAQGFGALEHPTATTVVFPESVSQEMLQKEMIDVVSHEFFHIVTPLAIHSEEIQNFNFNSPKMSKHLWLYEGVTEYFSNLFQVKEGLITENDFYKRISDKILNASRMNDMMPFTIMSQNVLKEPYKSQYLNVYEKGALIGMCLDIIIREKSDGKRGILDLMQKLSKEYGVSKAFNDDNLFSKITDLTYPEVGAFLNKYVSESAPIPYATFLEKMGVEKTLVETAVNIFQNEKVQYIGINDRNTIIINSNIDLNVFFTHLGLKGGDTILAINNKEYTSDNYNDILYDCLSWKENDGITIKIKRNNVEQVIKGKVKIPVEEIDGLKSSNHLKVHLREAWLKG